MILGMFFNSVKKACFLAESKAIKYSRKLARIRDAGEVTSKVLQKLVGFLVYAAWVMPFGRPFISQISNFINAKHIHKKIRFDPPALVACDIWLFLLKKNHGLSYDFILGKLPRAKDEWFVDASKYGYGGVCGNSFFKLSHHELLDSLVPALKNKFVDIFIAYRELLAVLLAFQVFAKISPKSYIRINSDNSNVVSWVNKGRCSKKHGVLILSAIEAFKFKYGLKVKAFYVKSSHNTSADALSRGYIPHWLKMRGVTRNVVGKELSQLLTTPLPFWKVKNTFSPF